MQSTLTSKGQITIPVAIRRKLGLSIGDVLEFDEHVPYLKATRAIHKGAWDAVASIVAEEGIDDPRRASLLLDELRGPVEAPARTVRRGSRRR